MVGPVVSQSERSTSTTAAISSSSTHCRPYGSEAGARSAFASANAVVASILCTQTKKLFRVEPIAVRFAGIAKSFGQRLTFPVLVEIPRPGRPDNKHLAYIHAVARLVLGDQNLVQLLTRTNAGVINSAAG